MGTTEELRQCTTEVRIRQCWDVSQRATDEVSVVVHFVKCPLATPAFDIRMPVQVLAALLLIQLPADTLGEAVEDGF